MNDRIQMARIHGFNLHFGVECHLVMVVRRLHTWQKMNLGRGEVCEAKRACDVEETFGVI